RAPQTQRQGEQDSPGSSVPDCGQVIEQCSKKCSERGKTVSAKEKGKLEDRAKADKAPYKERKTYIPLSHRGNDKEVKDPTKLQGKYEKDIPAYRANGKPEMAKKELQKLKIARKKRRTK
ncbi:High mobility group protein B1, partial [Galemys pyrenaicus]